MYKSLLTETRLEIQRGVERQRMTLILEDIRVGGDLVISDGGCGIKSYIEGRNLIE